MCFGPRARKEEKMKLIIKKEIEVPVVMSKEEFAELVKSSNNAYECIYVGVDEFNNEYWIYANQNQEDDIIAVPRN